MMQRWSSNRFEMLQISQLNHILPHSILLCSSFQVRTEVQSLRERVKEVESGHHHDVGSMEERLAELQQQLDEVVPFIMSGRV